MYYTCDEIDFGIEFVIIGMGIECIDWIVILVSFWLPYVHDMFWYVLLVGLT